jgi:hypothetical protein
VRAILEAGFVFWGVFLVFALIVVGYVVWMVRTERSQGSPRRSDEPVDSKGANTHEGSQ